MSRRGKSAVALALRTAEFRGTSGSTKGKVVGYGDKGGPSRSFATFPGAYVPKASRKERGEFNSHPTVKPIKLMEYLIRLITPLGGVLLDPFVGSGSTLLAARNLGVYAIGVDNNSEYLDIAARRFSSWDQDRGCNCQGRCENVPAGRSKTVPLNAVEWASRFVGRWRSGSVR